MAFSQDLLDESFFNLYNQRIVVLALTMDECYHNKGDQMNQNEYKEYLVIPTYDTILVPDVECQLGITELPPAVQSRLKIDGNEALLVPIRAEKEIEELETGDFYPLGVHVKVQSFTQVGEALRIHVEIKEKMKILSMTIHDGLITAEARIRDEIMDISAKGEEEFLEALKKTTLDLSMNFQGGKMAAGLIRSCDSVSEYAVMFLQFYGMSAEEKYALLETDSYKERCSMIQEALMRFKGTVDLQVEMNKMYDESEGNSYKKAAIRKQIGMLEQALSDLDPEVVTEENEYKIKIENSGMGPEARKEAERVLKRYLEAQPNDPEKNMLEGYLEFITALRWTVDPQEDVDLTEARKILDRDHYGLDKVKDRILEQMAVMQLRGDQAGSILLFVGAPGTGKTSLGKSIAEALGRSYVRISLGGVRDEAEIRGHRRTYIGAMPGRIMEGIKRAGTMNPVVVLDEVDKLSAGYNGDPASALLEVLDPEQNNNFTDHYMNIPYDLSHVLFICTANNLDTIPGPLLDRMEMIQLSGYTPVEKFHIGKEHLLARAKEDAGLKKSQLSVTDAAIRRMIEDYTMEAGVRGLKKQFDKLSRSAAAKIVRDGAEKVTVKEKDLPEYLGKKLIRHDTALKHPKAGVATGLAWTSVGGEILFIETAVMPGKGNIIITGQLGDVMKESATISVSLAKSLFISDKLDFSDKDIHIHVPQGAVPKDGPSAGVTLFTALTSLLSGEKVPSDLAMTGELSLRGDVLPIGGLPEKLMAAQRAGIHTVLIPKENERDLEDVPEEVRESLTIIPVSTAKEVIRLALGLTLPQHRTTLFEKEFSSFRSGARA